MARKRLASSGALAGLVALAGSAALPAPAAAQDPFACGAEQIEVSFGLTGQVEQWEVPAGVDSVRVIAAGGRGGSDAGPGGAGALAAGTFPVTPEATLHIIVAGQGGGLPGGGSGGGGSFVGVGGFSRDDGDLLLVAGGGGGGGGIGSGGNAGMPGSDGDPGGGQGGGQGGGRLGTGGDGGCEGPNCGGDGGGASEGSDGADGNVAGGGAGAGGNGGGFDPSRAPAMAAVNGGAGGEGFFDDNGGGFGGGGGGSGGARGGGGGGFAGGGSGGGIEGGGGGGSSFVAASVEDEASTAHSGNNGFVTLCYEEPPSPPSFSKSFSPASIVLGETSTLTFTIDNTGSAADATDLAFTDELPTGVTVADPASPADGCAGTLTAAPEADTIEYTEGTVTSGASCTVSVDVTSVTPGSHENTSSELSSSAGTSDPAVATLEVGEVTTTFEVETATGTGTATGSISGGGPGCAVAGVEALTVEEVAPGGPPPEVELPHGLFALELSGCDEGAAVEVELTLPSAIGSEYWKHGPTPDESDPHWYMVEAGVSGSTVTFALEDGGLGDSDLEANGTIVDPGGPSGVPPVPALPLPALAALALLLAVAAILLRHRNPA